MSPGNELLADKSSVLRAYSICVSLSVFLSDELLEGMQQGVTPTLLKVNLHMAYSLHLVH